MLAAPAASAAPAVQTAAPQAVNSGSNVSPNAVITTPAAPIQADYGIQKVRIGIRVAPGAVVPVGTSLAGATIQLQGYSGGQLLNTDTCVTEADGYCHFNFNSPVVTSNLTHVTPAQVSSFRAKIAKATPAVILPTPDPRDFPVPPGFSLTTTQLTAPANLVLDKSVLKLDTCQAADISGLCDPPVVTLLFNDKGLPPLAKNDSVKDADGGPVTIKVLANDTGAGAPITLKSVGPSQHGQTKITAGTIVYTPRAGFTGTDSFSYTISTGNGTSTAIVRVSVTAAPALVTASPAATGAVLANTGSTSTPALQWGFGAVTAGLALLFGAGRVGRSSVRRLASARLRSVPSDRRH
ncbi:MAG: hypothetical protein QOH56_4187 [Pseudonocardiales bacterium]|jgi:hypothetical protein|nr:hypothetical protein [Pseudonocardiales bacterium]